MSAPVAPYYGGLKPFQYADAIDPSFDKSQFDENIPLKALRIPAKHTGEAIKVLGKALIDMPKVKPVLKLESDPEHRLIILAQAHTGYADRLVTAAAEEDDTLPLSAAQRARLADMGATVTDYTLTIGYDHISAQVALRRLLPASIPTRDIPASFEIAGHLAHINLLAELMPYRKLIGRVLLDKNPHLRTVVAKTGVIDTVFRTFPMEVVAGDDDTIVEVRETGATFRFDYRDVYWNSRLGHEHEYIIKEAIPAGSIVADMFCGVGPFAVPLAMPPRSCIVHANDLNPSSYASLKANVGRNKIPLLTPSTLPSRSSSPSSSAPSSASGGGGGAAGGASATSATAPSTASSSAGAAAGDAATSTGASKGTKRARGGAGASTAAAAPGTQPGGICCYNMDGRDLVRSIVRTGTPFQYSLMNLPNDALAFLDAFVGLYRRHPSFVAAQAAGASSGSGDDAAISRLCIVDHTGKRILPSTGTGGDSGATPATGAQADSTTPLDANDKSTVVLPFIHCYCFSRTKTIDTAIQDVRRRVLAVLDLLPLHWDDAWREWHRKTVTATGTGTGSGASMVGGGGAASTAPASASAAGDADVAMTSTSSSSSLPVPVPPSLPVSTSIGGMLSDLDGSAFTDLPDAQIEALLTSRLPGFAIREVRDVAPNKIMVCVEFPLPVHVAFAELRVPLCAATSASASSEPSSSSSSSSAEAGASSSSAGSEACSGGGAGATATQAAQKRPRTEMSDGMTDASSSGAMDDDKTGNNGPVSGGSADAGAAALVGAETSGASGSAAKKSRVEE